MIAIAGILWLAGSCAMAALILLARARRRALARQLHELRGALTAARLAVDLMPLLGLEQPSVCIAASDELERSYHSLGGFEELLHEPVVPRPRHGRVMVQRYRRRRYLRGSVEPYAETGRLALVWAEAARRVGRELEFTWCGPCSGIAVSGQRREFAEVIANLLSNAIRHGDGTVRMRAEVDAGTLNIAVADDGPGLARPIAALTRAKRLGPHGHGLANAVRAAQRLGGSVTSAPSSGGALIVFSVPVRRAFDPLGDVDESSTCAVTPLPGSSSPDVPA